MVKDPDIKSYLESHKGFDEHHHITPYKAVIDDMYDRQWIAKRDYKKIRSEEDAADWLANREPQLKEFYVATSTPPVDVTNVINYLQKHHKVSKKAAAILKAVDQSENILNYLKTELSVSTDVIIGPVDWEDRNSVSGAIDALAQKGSTHPIFKHKDLIKSLLSFPDVKTYLQDTYVEELAPVKKHITSSNGVNIDYIESPVHSQTPDPFLIILAALKRKNIISEERHNELTTEYASIEHIHGNNADLLKVNKPEEPVDYKKEFGLVAFEMYRVHKTRELARTSGGLKASKFPNNSTFENWHPEAGKAGNHYEFIGRYDSPSNIAELFEHYPEIAQSVAERYGFNLMMKDKAQGQSRHIHMDIRKPKDPSTLHKESVRWNFEYSHSIFRYNSALLEEALKQITDTARQLFPLISSTPIPPKKRTLFEVSHFKETTKKDESGTRKVASHIEARYADGTANGYLAVTAYLAGLMKFMEDKNLIPPFIHPDYSADLKDKEGKDLIDGCALFVSYLMQNQVYKNKEDIKSVDILFALERDDTITKQQHQYLKAHFDEVMQGVVEPVQDAKKQPGLMQRTLKHAFLRRGTSKVHPDIETALDSLEIAEPALTNKLGPKLYFNILQDYGRSRQSHLIG